MIVSMETDGSYSEGPTLSLLQSNDGVGAELVQTEEGWLGFRATVSAVLLLELLLGVGGNLTVLVLYCGHCSLLESVSHAVTLSLHTLDLLLCLLCLPITAMLLLLGGASRPHHILFCCLHESAATFASVGTALNLLLISLDRYDISVRPANRLLTQRRAAFLLAGVWMVSLTLPILPFVEAGLGSGATDGAPIYSNSTLLCSQLVGTLQVHLFLQAPIFLCSLAVMLFTYSRILQALRIRIGHPAKAQRGAMHLIRRPWQRCKRAARSPDHMIKTVSISPPPLSTGPLVASDTITTVTLNTDTNTPSVNTPLSPTPTSATVTTPFVHTPNVGLSLAAVPLNPMHTLSSGTTPLNHEPDVFINTPVHTTIVTIPVNHHPTISTIKSHLNPYPTPPTTTTHLNSLPNTSTITIQVNHNPTMSTMPFPLHPDPTPSTVSTQLNLNTTRSITITHQNPNPTTPTKTTHLNPNPTTTTITDHLNPNTTISTIFVSPYLSSSTSPAAIPSDPNPVPSTISIPRNPNPSIPTKTTPLRHSASSTLLPITSTPPISTTPLSPTATHPPPNIGVGASVSAILALRRAVRRHRDRRERQKRVFRMSVIIVLSFLLCWAPLSITPLLHLAIGPSDWLERLRVCFLVLAYWTVVLHPLLYAFTRQKLRKVLHTRLRRLRNNNNNTNTHTVAQIKQRNRRKYKAGCGDAADGCCP